MYRKLITITALLSIMSLHTHAGAVSELHASYQTQGAGPFSAEAGEVLWKRSFTDAKSGKQRSCETCHGTDLGQTGKHTKTGKVIEPMAPSVNPERLIKAKKIRKWLLRNCKWTLGRECTAQEKGDLLVFLSKH